MIEEIEKILWELICRGGGDADTIREYAEEIALLKNMTEPPEFRDTGPINPERYRK